MEFEILFQGSPNVITIHRKKFSSSENHLYCLHNSEGECFKAEL